MICSFKDVLKEFTLYFVCVFCFEGLQLVYITYPLQFETIDLFFISKILVFEIIL